MNRENTVGTNATQKMPSIRQVATADLMAAIAAGWRDFRRAPVFGLAVTAPFVLGGLLIWLQFLFGGQSWLILVVACGFPLVGPFVVVGLYEVSHELQQGQRPTWAGVLGRIFAARDRQIPSLAFIVTFFLGIWFYVAHLIFALFFGLSSMTNISTSYDLLLTPNGLTMLAVGSAVGAALSFFLFSISVVSFPLVIDRDVDFVTAMITSVRAVARNLPVMILWAALIGVLTLIAMVPLFLGLFVVMPVLGHATWHLYCALVEPA